jgi:hypothetical protein
VQDFPYGLVRYKSLEPNNRKDLSLPTCFFATDLHGKTDRYDKLLASIIGHLPAAVFLGGDLLPRSALSAIQFGQEDFVHDYLVPAFTKTRSTLGVHYPDIFAILGNDDPRRCEEDFIAAAPTASGTTSTNRRVSGEFRDLWPCLHSANPISIEGLGTLRRFAICTAWVRLSGGG